MLLGGLLIIAVYFLQLFIVYSRSNDFILFSVLCFTVSALLIVETWKTVIGYSYDWHYFRLIVASVLTFMIALLLPLFFLYQFNIKYKVRWIGSLLIILSVIILSVSRYEFINIAMFISSFIMSLLIIVQAMHLKRQGSLMAAFAVAMVTLTNLSLPYSFQEQYFYPGFALLILIVLTSLSQKMKTTQQQRNTALLNSARLEINLLKRNIQPHFIFNTLTSIEQWIEEDPKVAIKFIDALADEFRVLNAMSEHKLVTLSDEIELCQSHIRIMSYRKDQAFTLELNIVNPVQLVPPAIIHTLVENALSHNRYNNEQTLFKLHQKEAAGQTLITFYAPLGINFSEQNKSSGTGLKYIKARLEESFADNWQLEELQVNKHWITKISFPIQLNVDNS